MQVQLIEKKIVSGSHIDIIRMNRKWRKIPYVVCDDKLGI